MLFFALNGGREEEPLQPWPLEEQLGGGCPPPRRSRRLGHILVVVRLDVDNRALFMGLLVAETTVRVAGEGTGEGECGENSGIKNGWCLGWCQQE